MGKNSVQTIQVDRYGKVGSQIGARVMGPEPVPALPNHLNLHKHVCVNRVNNLFLRGS